VDCLQVLGIFFIKEWLLIKIKSGAEVDKYHMRRFNGIKPDNFYWFLKEREWRFNGGDHVQLLTQITSWYTHAKH
jgi:transposase-like protein